MEVIVDNIPRALIPWLWTFKFGTGSLLSGGLGWVLVNYLRQSSRVKSVNTAYLSYVPLIAPIFVYLVFCLVACFGIWESWISDCSAFGFMIGMLWRLSFRAKKDTIRLCVHEVGSSDYAEVWLKNTDVTVSEGLQLIAHEFKVPVNRIAIESGRGKFIDTPNAALVPTITSSTLEEDLFGFSTIHCYVSIEDEHDEQNVPGEGGFNRRGSLSLSGMLPGLMDGRHAIRYGMDITLSGKIPNAANDSKAFNISLTELYAAAAPSASPDLVRFVGWRESADDDESSSVAKFESSLSGQKLQNGDCVVLENHGKFMSVVRGWWIAWSSSVPRRSGAFRVEVMEKASLNTLEKGMEAFKGKLLKKEEDNSVRVGDVFRLRSVKFPGFELGVTGVRLTDEYFHLGLRKIDDDNPNWCLPLQFTCKVKKEFSL